MKYRLATVFAASLAALAARHAPAQRHTVPSKPPITTRPPAAAPARAQTYANPVWNHDFPDPFVLAANGKFYAYATQNSDAGFQLMASPDLVHWTQRPAPFKPPWAKEHYWAPEVVAYRGKYYLTYSALNPQTRKHDIGIAVADSPLGPFKDRAILVRGDANKVGVIDTTVFIDADKTPYLLYAEEDPRRIVLRKLSPDLMTAGDMVTEIVRPDRPEERGVTEAPTLIRRNGMYHLFFSAGWYASYKKDACYAVYHASSRSLRGPYKKDAQPVLQTVPGQVYGPGHQSILTLPGGAMWIVYHGWNNEKEPMYGSNPIGRSLRIDPLLWRGDTPYTNGPTTTAQTAPRIVMASVSSRKPAASVSSRKPGSRRTPRLQKASG